MKRCRVCKCTEDRACWPPCAWEPNEPDLCSNCADAIRAVQEWLIGAHRPSISALIAEARKPHSPGTPKRTRKEAINAA